jgi:RNA polymerase sigma-70 factor (ECF subfamily)
MLRSVHRGTVTSLACFVQAQEKAVIAMTATGLLDREHADGPAWDGITDQPGVPGTPGTDEEFMRVLYDRYRSPLLGYVTRLTHDSQWAEDIVQATLVRAWRAREQLTLGEAATRSWLFTAAYRIFIDDYRSRSARPMTLTGQDIAAPSADVNETERLDWSVTLASALEALSKPHRQAIVYVYYLSRTIDETASLLGVSPGTIKSRLYYAVRALRDQLTPALGY